MKEILAVAVAGLAYVVATSFANAQEFGDAKKGAILAERICAQCHAVKNGEARSPNSNAPKFGNVAKTSGMTPTALRVWLQTSHPTMPNLVLENDEKDNIIAYLLSLKSDR